MHFTSRNAPLLSLKSRECYNINRFDAPPNFSTNYAYYKAGYKANISDNSPDFWIRVQNNFLDIAILEWSKLFLKSRNNKYHWSKIVKNRDNFQNLVKDYDHSYIEIYRDKFLAHLDNKVVINMPKLDGA